MGPRRAIAALAMVAIVAVAGCGDKSKDEAAPASTLRLGVLAPVEGTYAPRGKDLVDGARMAADEVNRGGGVLGSKVELQVINDDCSAEGGEQAAASLVETGGVAGIVGGVCDAAAQSEVGAIDNAGIPFLIASATEDDLVSFNSKASFQLNGTRYQQALSSIFWMSYQRAQRLVVVTEDTPESAALAEHVAERVESVPKLLSRQQVDADAANVGSVAKAVLKDKPDFVLWTGGAEAGGKLLAALRDAGYEKGFTATAASEDPAFLQAAGDAAEGAFVLATASPANTPKATSWATKFSARYKRDPSFDAQQGYDAVRVLTHAIKLSKTTESTKVAEQIATLDPEFGNALGLFRFASDHTLLYDNRVILTVKDGAFTWERSLRTDSAG